MFDIGFFELTLIAVVGLLVIGPERLPRVARTVGLWIGRMRGFVMSVKADVDKELRADELKRIMEEQARSSGIHEIMEETRESFDDLNRDTDYLVKAVSEEKAGDGAVGLEDGETAEKKADSSEVKRKDDE